MPASVKRTLLFCQPWPCNPVATTALQPLIEGRILGLNIYFNVEMDTQRACKHIAECYFNVETNNRNMFASPHDGFA